MVIHRKRIDLYERRLGAVAECNTKVVYICMLWRVGSFKPDSTMFTLCKWKNKLNDALNDAVAKANQHILMINRCNTYEHFDCTGDLSMKGKEDFWWELHELIQKFDLDKIKLLPNPKNPPKQLAAHGQDHRHNDWSSHDQSDYHRRRLHSQSFHHQRFY